MNDLGIRQMQELIVETKDFFAAPCLELTGEELWQRQQRSQRLKEQLERLCHDLYGSRG